MGGGKRGCALEATHFLRVKQPQRMSLDRDLYKMCAEHRRTMIDGVSGGVVEMTREEFVISEVMDS